ncbi:PhzF family phenazine biosynthesis protein [Kribbella deserti]|uniref:PhzF family phenazine biosynthesis protein n=1 Tax=Kribbella deserti TaxID=1926257 RepID=A0ABV6QVU4_9ACTN
MSVQHTVVFADGPGGGNPCPVVFGAEDWPEERMQALAATYGQETGFVLPPAAGGALRLRYFVPRHEMEMCVHATVASVVVAGRRNGWPAGPVNVETPLGPLEVQWDGVDHVMVQQFPPVFGEAVEDLEPVLAALGAGDNDLDLEVGPVVSVSTARPKLFVPLRSEEALDRLQPDSAAVDALSEGLAVTGVYAFTVRAKGADAAARQFPRGAGYPEDPATGVAACALGAYLAHYRGTAGTLTIAQGRAMGRPSLIKVQAQANPSARPQVGGHAYLTGV